MNENDANKKVEEFNNRCGDILRKALHIESTLDFFISNYFCFPQTPKTFLLEDSVLSKINFQNKLNIFIEICKDEDIDKPKIDNIKKSIKFVKEIRNKVAHTDSLFEEDTIKLCPGGRIKYKKDQIELTEQLIKEIEENRLNAIKGIYEIHLLLSDLDRKRKEKIF